MTMPELLKDKTIVLTGAGQGLGEATAFVLAEAGAKLMLLDVNESTLQEVAGQLASAGRTVETRVCNISREEDVAAAAAATRDRYGRCDGLVNNAGVVGFTPLEDLSLEEWNRLISVNLTGTFLCIKHFGRIMLEQRSGSIVTITSTAASIPQSKSGAYSPSKAGAHHSRAPGRHGMGRARHPLQRRRPWRHVDADDPTLPV